MMSVPGRKELTQSSNNLRIAIPGANICTDQMIIICSYLTYVMLMYMCVTILTQYDLFSSAHWRIVAVYEELGKEGSEFHYHDIYYIAIV